MSSTSPSDEQSDAEVLDEAIRSLPEKLMEVVPEEEFTWAAWCDRMLVMLTGQSKPNIPTAEEVRRLFDPPPYAAPGVYKYVWTGEGALVPDYVGFEAEGAPEPPVLSPTCRHKFMLWKLRVDVFGGFGQMRSYEWSCQHCGGIYEMDTRFFAKLMEERPNGTSPYHP